MFSSIWPALDTHKAIPSPDGRAHSVRGGMGQDVGNKLIRIERKRNWSLNRRMIYGFDISHFRNFAEVPQPIAPLGKVNVFIGSNNSGKSNILRYVRDFLSPAIKDVQGRNSQLSAQNRSRFVQDDPKDYVLYFPINDEVIDEKFKARTGHLQSQYREIIRKFPRVTSCGNFIGVPVKREANNHTQRANLRNEDVASVDANELQVLVANTGGGHVSPQQGINFVLNRLVEGALPIIDPVYVPAFRQIKTRLNVFSNEYEEDHNSKSHIIEELVQYSNPTYDQQQKRASFDKLESFISDITLIEDISIDIPFDRSTINVEINGYKRPLETMGSGVHELFMLASMIVLNEGKTVLLEEPEIHLHPEFQRKLMNFISNEIDGQFFITTHSAAIIDTPDAKVFGVVNEDGRGKVQPLLRDHRRHEICRELGYRASDILQSNCIIWVEGPSDRLYLNYWLKNLAPDLREGIEYSIMFYGGRLLSHLSVEDSYVEEFISLLPINRSVAILMDSDLGSPSQDLRGTKSRVIEEVRARGGYAWVTEGREVENYVPLSVREAAVKIAHPSAEKLSGARNRYGKPLNYLIANGTEVSKSFNKIRIAKEAINIGFGLDEFDLNTRMAELVDFVKTANR